MRLNRRTALSGLASLSVGMIAPRRALGAPAAATAPGDDFYAFVNAADLKAMTLPPGNWERGNFNIVSESVTADIETLVKQASPDSEAAHEARVGQVYRAMLDEAALEAGLPRLKKEVARILTAPTPEAVAAIMAHPRSSSLVGFYIAPSKGEWILHMDQQSQRHPMLGLPREMYEGADSRAAEVRRAYVAHITELLTLAGVADAARRAPAVLALETQIARRLWSQERLRDRRANAHVMSVAELERFAPGLPWAAVLEARGLSGAKRVNLGTDTAVAAQARLFSQTPLDDWRSWLAFSWVRNGIDVAPRALRDAHWRFAGEVLRPGAPRVTREAEAIGFVNQNMAMDVGRLYVDARFSEADRRQVSEMLTYLKRAMAERLRAATWLDAPSRTEALVKLDAMSLKAGYPRRWPEAAPGLSRDDAAANLDALLQHDWAQQRRRLDDPSARTEIWYQAPQLVNASYGVFFNAIEVPAAILQPPFYYSGGDPARNFGAIGAIVGHEIGHGFDDQGLLFDAKGDMRDWMSPASQAKFKARAQRMIAQVDAVEPLPGVRLNGARTVGETTADLMGLSLALRAYELWRADHAPATSLAEARRALFRSWAKVWLYKANDDAIRSIANFSYTVPARYRVNLSVRNIDAWYEAFNVKPGDKLYVAPADRVRLW